MYIVTKIICLQKLATLQIFIKVAIRIQAVLSHAQGDHNTIYLFFFFPNCHIFIDNKHSIHFTIKADKN